MRIAVLADDNTGATDAAGMFTSFGARAVLLMSEKELEKQAGPEASPGRKDLRSQEDRPGMENRPGTEASGLEDFDVLVVGTRIRSVSPDEARRKTAETTALLKRRGYEMIQLKYCSTFDSTREGNIGPSLDAAGEVLGFSSAPVCPALPVNGRTTYMGYHFVWGELLSESALSRHPLNPMTDAHLPRWLGYQTGAGVGLVDHGTVRLGAEEIRRRRRELEAAGVIYHVTDAIVQEDIDAVLTAYEDTGFLSGGSGISEAMGRKYFAGRDRPDFSDRLKKLEKKIVVICGSQSPATARQKKTAVAAGFKEVLVHPREILKGRINLTEVAEEIRRSLADPEVPGTIISTDEKDGGDVESVHAEAAKLGLSPIEAGEKISDCLGRIAAELISGGEHEDTPARVSARGSAGGVDRILVAGGETSGAVCFEAGIEALEVGLQMDPGVPYCFPVGRDGPMVVLKSGNFGGDDLFVRAGILEE